MKMQTEITVVGMKANKGQLDNGQTYDSTKVFALTDLDARKGNALGQGVAEYTIGDSQEFLKYKHLGFPFKAVADMEVVVSGQSTKLIVTGLKPVAKA